MGRGNNSAINFASWITAERRWAMTGTPTRQTLTQSGLSNILGLMGYLRHDFFSRRRDGESVWQSMIVRSWNQGHLASFFRLKSLLSFLMVRHTKLDIVELAPPKYQTTILPMTYEEVTTYNTLVCAIQSNLLITSMQGKTSGLQDSLLHRSQSKHAKDALRNVRLVCAGGTRVIPSLTADFLHQFFVYVKAYRLSTKKLKRIKSFVHCALSGELSMCDCCGMFLSTLLVFPCCGALVCTECADGSSNTCILCEKTFDVDNFQKLQPGFDHQWLHNIEEEAKNKKRNRFVNLADAAANGDDNSNTDHAPSVPLEDTGGAGMLVPLHPQEDRPQRRRTRRPGDGHVCEYDPRDPSGTCILCWQEHNHCNLMSRSGCCSVCFRRAEKCPGSESKASYIIDKLIKLYNKQQLQREQQKRLKSPPQRHVLVSHNDTPMVEDKDNMEPFDQADRRPLKVIVFSQFPKALNMVGDRLLRRFGTACVAEYWGKFRKQELAKFRDSCSSQSGGGDCFCMLLGKDGSEGLDLSFVTHIIFLEQVWDKSLEQQAVARAWRMGAKGCVQVETIVAEQSIEETMRELEHENSATSSNNNNNSSRRGLRAAGPDDDNNNSNDNNATQAPFLTSSSLSTKSRSDVQHAKLRYLLQSVELVKNAATVPLIHRNNPTSCNNNNYEKQESSYSLLFNNNNMKANNNRATSNVVSAGTKRSHALSANAQEDDSLSSFENGSSTTLVHNSRRVRFKLA